MWENSLDDITIPVAVHQSDPDELEFCYESWESFPFGIADTNARNWILARVEIVFRICGLRMSKI